MVISPILCFLLGLPQEIHVFIMSWIGNAMFFDILIDKLLDCKTITVEDVALESDGGVPKVFPHC